MRYRNPRHTEQSYYPNHRIGTVQIRRIDFEVVRTRSVCSLDCLLERPRLQSLILLQYKRDVTTAVGMRGISHVLPMSFYAKVRGMCHFHKGSRSKRVSDELLLCFIEGRHCCIAVRVTVVTGLHI
jgi:hypothetical protein